MSSMLSEPDINQPGCEGWPHEELSYPLRWRVLRCTLQSLENRMIGPSCSFLTRTFDMRVRGHSVIRHVVLWFADIVIRHSGKCSVLLLSSVFFLLSSVSFLLSSFFFFSSFFFVNFVSLIFIYSPFPPSSDIRVSVWSFFFLLFFPLSFFFPFFFFPFFTFFHFFPIFPLFLFPFSFPFSW